MSIVNYQIVNTINGFVQRHHLMESNGKYLVALSGGADSVALMLVLKDLGYNIEAVHCNFHLRGEESDRDELFCKNLCESIGVAFHVAHFDTDTYATLHHVSIEMAARELRYNYFEQLRESLSASGICVAHHRDDSVETVLLNLIRGTGLHGLKGISPKNGYIIRPMLCVSREDVELFLHSRGQQFVIDSTNNEDDAVRNRIRHHVLPLLETINPSVRTSIMDTAARIREADKVLVAALESAKTRVENESRVESREKREDNGVVLNIGKILHEPSPEYLLFHILTPYDFSSSMIEDIASYLCSNATLQSGKSWRSATHELIIDRENLLVASASEKYDLNIRMPEAGVYCFNDSEGIERKIKVEMRNVSAGYEVSKNPSCVMLDASNISFPLTVRYAISGDRFVPFGMKGSKLISDFLTDQKRSLIEKRRQLVVENGNGDILWLVNNRTDNRYRCEPSSEQLLVLSFDY